MLIVECLIGGQRYALDLAYVREIIRLVALSHIDCQSKLIEGAINVRDQIIPIINVRHYLGLSETEYELSHQIIICACQGMFCGIIVDQALGIENYEYEYLASEGKRVENTKLVSEVIRRGDIKAELLDICELNRKVQRVIEGH
ncbi:chemotaxis protein CheW [bacterium]|nr:chemotaxis protein CheW [bacterium]